MLEGLRPSVGLVFVAEVKRKEKEKADKLQKMQERARPSRRRIGRIDSRPSLRDRSGAGHGCVCWVGETAS